MWNGVSSWRCCDPSLQKSGEIWRSQNGGVSTRKLCLILIYFMLIIFSIKIQLAEDFTQRHFINLKVTAKTERMFTAGRALSTASRPALGVTFSSWARGFGRALSISFSRLNQRFIPSETCGTVRPVEHPKLFQSRRSFPSNIDDWVSWGYMLHMIEHCIAQKSNLRLFHISYQNY